MARCCMRINMFVCIFFSIQFHCCVCVCVQARPVISEMIHTYITHEWNIEYCWTWWNEYDIVVLFIFIFIFSIILSLSHSLVKRNSNFGFGNIIVIIKSIGKWTDCNVNVLYICISHAVFESVYDLIIFNSIIFSLCSTNPTSSRLSKWKIKRTVRAHTHL